MRGTAGILVVHGGEDVNTLIDNVTDFFMPGQDPARRLGPGSGPRRRSAMIEEAQVPGALVAGHGFSMLVTVAKAGREHRSLFDVEITPDGVTEYAPAGHRPGSIEAVVCSYGHFGHTHRDRRSDPGGRPGRTYRC